MAMLASLLSWGFSMIFAGILMAKHYKKPGRRQR
jgi:short subunit fatty acids transporter